jgi:phosphoserine phosphatase
MNFGSREWYEFVFKQGNAEKAWEHLLSSTIKEEYKGHRLCAEKVYREMFGRLLGELSPEEILQEKRKMIERLQSEIAEAEAEPVADPVKDVPVEPVVEEPVVVAPVEEPKPKQRGRPRAMTIADFQPK